MAYNYYVNQSENLTRLWSSLGHQYEIILAKMQTFLSRNVPAAGSNDRGLYLQAQLKRTSSGKLSFQGNKKGFCYLTAARDKHLLKIQFSSLYLHYLETVRLVLERK